jgi:hypothetical protein
MLTPRQNSEQATGNDLLAWPTPLDLTLCDRLTSETHLRTSSSLNLFFKSGDTISGL